MKSDVRLANFIFNTIRNCPLDLLNTEAFRRDLLAGLEDFRLNFTEEEFQSLASRLASYSVMFVPQTHSNTSSNVKCALYTFDDFHGVYFVSNFLTLEQCDWLAHETLTRYINPPSNSNLLVNDPSLTGPIWPGELFSKFKWATVGHLYDWGTRTFNGFVQFPNLLKRLVDYVNQQLKQYYTPFEPNAAIINCYSGSYFLRLHKDDAEATNDAILNFSLGEAAIFCVGGVDQSTIPLSMVLDSGSLLILSGTSRNSLHGIAKLLHYSKPVKGGKTKGLNYNKLQLEPPQKLEAIHGRARLLKELNQCPNELFHDVDKNISREHLKLLNGIRTSISIRRAV